MLGTSRQPAPDARDPMPGGIAGGNPVSPRYTLVASAKPAATAERPRPFLGIGRTIKAWLQHLRQRREFVELNTHLLRDIGLSLDWAPAEEERRACSVPFRLPRQ
jgi:uncharacterized protein YjiS (DUF1127 family)